MKVFVAGSKNISSLDREVQRRLSSICEKGYSILVGDCYGVDSQVQEFCFHNNYRDVSVYANNGFPRNNIGAWPVNTIIVTASVKDFEFYSKKDAAMCRDADYGYMIWDGRSKGTLRSIADLAEQGKMTLIYLSPVHKTVHGQSKEELEKLIAICPAETRALYSEIELQPTQISLFD